MGPLRPDQKKREGENLMTKCNKRTALEMNRDIFYDQAIKGYYDTRYSMAWKAATIELSTNISKVNQGKHGFGVGSNTLRIPGSGTSK